MVSKEAKAIYREIAKEAIHLVKFIPIREHFHLQIKSYYKEPLPPPGAERTINMSGAYLVIADIHDKYGGINKIITNCIRSQCPEKLEVIYYPEHSKVLLENIKADLESKGLLDNKSSSKTNKHAELPHTEIDLARKILKIGKEEIMPSNKVWDFLKELCDANSRDEAYPKTADWKNQKDRLRILIKNKLPESIYTIFWPKFIMSINKRFYKFGVPVETNGGAQIGFRKTKLENNERHKSVI